jgi:BirA family transcriptional regulator, biotin operon repressor / biotin---[acetyl-CoA-carboxylase] ligase
MAEHRTWLDGVPFDWEAAGITGWQHESQVGSTMDVAHQRASEGAPSGLVVLTDVQLAGRGRTGKAWLSRAGDGVWFTLVERGVSADALQVLSLRVGLALVDAMAAFTDDRLWLKWPNDVLLGPRDVSSPSPAALAKLAGVLVEARWRESQVEWVAIGVGVNLRRPDPAPPGVRPGALRSGVTRAQVLAALVPRLRVATQRDGMLSPEERAEWQARDAMVGQRCTAPEAGVVQGIDASGALLVRNGTITRAHRSGSLEFGAPV